MRPTRRTIWELAVDAAKRVATWPAWKVRAADEALTEESRALGGAYRSDVPRCPECGGPATHYVTLWDYHLCARGHEWDGPLNGGPDVHPSQRHS